MEGYEYEPKSDNGNYLTLKSKGQKARIRVVSKPYQFTEPDLKGKIADRFAWIVIDKTTPTEVKVKGFKSGVMIYKAIKDLVTNEEWGDPSQYDITIERTEEDGSYYKVIASPNKTPLSEPEQKMIEEAKLDLAKMYKPKNQASVLVYDDITDLTPNDPPPADKPEEEIDLSDIPF